MNREELSDGILMALSLPQGKSPKATELYGDPESASQESSYRVLWVIENQRGSTRIHKKMKTYNHVGFLVSTDPYTTHLPSLHVAIL